MLKLILDVTMKRNVIMRITKRNKWAVYNIKKLPYERFAKFPHYTKLIKGMGYDKGSTKKMLLNHPFLFDVPTEDIKSVYDICTEWKVDLTMAESDPKIFAMRPDTVKCTIMTLQEMGVKSINAPMISHYQVYARWRMSDLKIAMDIPLSVSIAQNLLKYIGPIPPNAPPLNPPSDDLALYKYLARFYEWYLSWRLNLSEDEKSTLDLTGSCIKHRSVRILKRQIELLHDDVGLTGSEILEYGCLISGSPEDLERVLVTVKTFGGIDIKRLIRIRPVLSKMEYDNVINVIESLKKYGYTDKMMRRYPQVLLIPHKKLVESLDTIENTLEFRVLKNNTRSLRIVQNIRLALARLEYLRHHNMRHITVWFLTGPRSKVEKIIRTGIDKTNAKEIGYSFEKILKYDCDEIIQGIKKHPYWRRVDIVSMNDTANYLLRLFPPRDIHDSIQLLLYPKSAIERTLKNLPELTEKSKKTEKLSGKQILALCLYEIEKEHHFSGDGVWREYRSSVGACVIPENIEAELSDASDSENTETDDTGPADELQINAWLTKMLQKKVRPARRS